MKAVAASIISLALLIMPAQAKAGAQSAKPPSICGLTGALEGKFERKLLSESDGEIWVDRIVEASGLKRNFLVYTAPIYNAVAFIEDGERIIVFDPQLFEALETKAQSQWVGVSIMAHEIGHHLNGHTNLDTGSQPKLELEADFFSGFVLQKLGASVDDARAAMKRLSPTHDSDTHPGRKRRLTAITAGWNKACASDEHCMPEADDEEVTSDSSLFGSSTDVDAVIGGDRE